MDRIINNKLINPSQNIISNNMTHEFCHFSIIEIIFPVHIFAA
jgi:hypothetical protein